MPVVKKMSITLLFSLLAALSMILVVLVTYWRGPEVFLSPAYLVGTTIIILLASVACVLEKRAKGGQLDFRAALRVAYGVLALGVIAQNFVTWLLLNVINPAYKQRLIPIALANTEMNYRRFGVPQDQIKQTLDGIRTEDQFTLGRILSAMAFLLVIYFLIALLIAATVRTKNGPTPRPGR